MQLIETNVHSGQGTTTVEFVGEGGEKVSVCVVALDVPEDAAIMRAKEIMVQLTAFDPGPEQQNVVSDEAPAVTTTGSMSEARG